MRRLFYYFLCLMMMGHASCDVINPEEEVPAYLHILPFDVNTSTEQGSASNKLTDGWVYVGGDYLGTYTLPITIPVLASGEEEIIVFPGIKDNGISSTPDIYLFYQRYDVTLNLQPNVTDTIQPVTTYEDLTQFRLIENFESTSHTLRVDLDNDPASNVVISKDATEVFEGVGVGKIELTRKDSLIMVGLNPLMDLPTPGASGYVELDYKNDISMILFLQGLNVAGDVIIVSEFNRILTPKDDWNKIYLNFTQDFRNMDLAGVAAYQLVLRAAIPLENGAPALDEATIFLDNLKILHF